MPLLLRPHNFGDANRARDHWPEVLETPRPTRLRASRVERRTRGRLVRRRVLSPIGPPPYGRAAQGPRKTQTPSDESTSDSCPRSLMMRGIQQSLWSVHACRLGCTTCLSYASRQCRREIRKEGSRARGIWPTGRGGGQPIVPHPAGYLRAEGAQSRSEGLIW